MRTGLSGRALAAAATAGTAAFLVLAGSAAAWVPAAFYEPSRAAPGEIVHVSVEAPCGGTTIYLWPGRLAWEVAHPSGPADRRLVRVPLRPGKDGNWRWFVVPRVPAGWYTPFFQCGDLFTAAGSADGQLGQIYFEVLPGAPDTATDVGAASTGGRERSSGAAGLLFLVACVTSLALGPGRSRRPWPNGLRSTKPPSQIGVGPAGSSHVSPSRVAAPEHPVDHAGGT